MDVAFNGVNMATGADVAKIDSLTTIEQERKCAQTEFFSIFQTGFCKRLIYQLAPLVAVDWPEHFLTVGK